MSHPGWEPKCFGCPAGERYASESTPGLTVATGFVLCPAGGTDRTVVDAVLNGA